MKKKFLIPVLGLAVAAMVSFFNKEETTNMASLFIESDNIAFAESGPYCLTKTNSRCWINRYGANNDPNNRNFMVPIANVINWRDL